MRFSTDEFYYELKEHATNPNEDGSIFTLLYDTMKTDLMGFISSNLGGDLKNEADDVFHMVYLSVWRALPQFLNNSELMHENQRAAWLMTITNRRIADCLRKYYHMKNEQPLEDELINSIPDNNSQPEKQVFDKMISEKVLLSLTQLFSIKTSPEKIIGFLYSKIIIPIETGGRCNGRPTETAERLVGKTLFEIRNEIVDDLEMTFEGHIPLEVFTVFDEKLNKKNEKGIPVGEQQFGLDIKKITDGTNRIQTKLQEKESEIYGKSFGV